MIKIVNFKKFKNKKKVIIKDIFKNANINLINFYLKQKKKNRIKFI